MAMQKMVITNQGNDLVTKLIAGTATANFTKIAATDYDYTGAVLSDLTDLLEIKQESLVSDTIVSDYGTVKVMASLPNLEVTEGYYIRAIGLYVLDSSTMQEILYGVSIYDPAKPLDYQTPFGGDNSGYSYTFNVKVSNASQVDVTVDPSAIPSMEQFMELKNTVNGHIADDVAHREVHGLRYTNGYLEVMNADGEWECADKGIQVEVTAPVDSIVKVTNGVVTMNKPCETGTVTFVIPYFDTWNISASDEMQQVSNIVQLVANEKRVYTVGLSFLDISLTVAAPSGAVVTVSDGLGHTQTATVYDESTTFAILDFGTYQVTATFDGCTSQTAEVEINAESAYSVQTVWTKLNITVEDGSAVTVTNGEYTHTATSSGVVTVYLETDGDWTVSATLNSQSTSQTISVTEYQSINVTLSYFSAILTVNAETGAYVTVTDGTHNYTGTTTNGSIEFEVLYSGTYTISATINGVSSDTKTLSVIQNGASYSIAVNFVTLTVNIDTGSVVVATCGSATKTATTVGGTCKMYLPNTGTWNVSAVLNGQSTSGSVNASAYTGYTLTLAYTKTMTVEIDLSNSNPATCCTYKDDAVGMTPGSDAWDDFFGHYPVLLKNGAEQGKLKRNDFTKFENGAAADITSGNAGDVMIAFPRRGLKITTNGNKITISMTDAQNDANFKYYAHKRGSTDKNVFYLGVYKGYEASSKLRSLSGKTITANKTIGAFRTLARANGGSNGSGGSGYDQSGFYQLVFRQCMFILKYRNLNSQVAVGRGYVDGNSAAKATGGTETKGMDWGETTGKDHMKLFGLEDFWGNVYEWIDGIWSDGSRNVCTATENFNDTGSGYTNNGNGGVSSNIGSWLSKPQGTTEAGFVAKEVSGSETTYFCDFASLNASLLAYFGGVWNDASCAGAFPLTVDCSASSAAATIAARLMYL